MDPEQLTAVAVLAVLQIKHFAFDFALQRPYDYFKNKGTYGHPGGLVHAGLHILGTIPALLIARPPIGIALAILAGEFLIHYHLDWGKEQFGKAVKLSAANTFLVIGLDQLGHQLTYVAILWVLFANS